MAPEIMTNDHPNFSQFSQCNDPAPPAICQLPNNERFMQKTEATWLIFRQFCVNLPRGVFVQGERSWESG